MAWYVDPAHVFHVNSDHVSWSTQNGPGALVAHSGIYRCGGCNKEVTCNAGDHFPPQNHHQHTILAGGPVLWQLLVATNTEGR